MDDTAFARHIERALTSAGITVAPVAVGQGSILLCLDDGAGQQGIVRLSEFPEADLRESVREAHRAAGWYGQQRIITTSPDGSNSHAVPDVVRSVLTHFGVDPDVRDKLVASAEVSARRSAGTARRLASRDVIEQRCAEGVAAIWRVRNAHTLDVWRARRATLASLATRSVEQEGLPQSAVGRIHDAALRIIAEETPRGELANLPTAVLHGARFIHRRRVFDHLSRVVKTRPWIDAEALRATVWEAMDGCPIDWRVQQAAWLHEWSREAPASDLIPDDLLAEIDRNTAALAAGNAFDDVLASEGADRGNVAHFDRNTIAGLALCHADKIRAAMRRVRGDYRLSVWAVVSEVQRDLINAISRGRPYDPSACIPFRTTADVLAAAAAR